MKYYVKLCICVSFAEWKRLGICNFVIRVNMRRYSLLAEVSICAGNSKEKRPLPRSDTSSVHDRGRVKPVCKTSSETGLEKQIVRMLRAELRCNDIEPVVSKWRLGQRSELHVFYLSGMITCGRNVKPIPTPLDASWFVIGRAVMAYKGTETDVLYGVAIRPRGDGV
jgi:hypothetical protein